MQKWLCLLLVVFCLVIAGCSATPEDNSEDSVPVSDPSETAFITEEKALSLAEKFWDIQSGDRDPDTGFLFSLMVFEYPTKEKPEYRIALRWLVNDSHFSTVDQVQVNALTGEVYYAQ